MRIRIFSLLSLVALSSLALAAGCGSTDTVAGLPAGGGSAITVSNNLFSPTPLSVKAGTTVTWNWASNAVTHNVTFDDGAPGSGDKDAGGSFSRTFSTTGTFLYHCTIHSGMTGTVTVTAAN